SRGAWDAQDLSSYQLVGRSGHGSFKKLSYQLFRTGGHSSLKKLSFYQLFRGDGSLKKLSFYQLFRSSRRPPAEGSALRHPSKRGENHSTKISTLLYFSLLFSTLFYFIRLQSTAVAKYNGCRLRFPSARTSPA